MADRDAIIDHLQTEIAALDLRLDTDNELIRSLQEQLAAHKSRTGDTRRTQIYRRAAMYMIPDDDQLQFSNLAPMIIEDMGEALVALGGRLDHKFAEIKALSEITQHVTNEVAAAALSNDGPLTLGGNIDNFIGDAIIAVFGVPMAKQDDTAHAVAIEMQNAMALVNAKIEGRDLPDLKMGIGLSTGDVVAANIGSELRCKFSVIGVVVNLAARIEGMVSGSQVFASDATLDDVRGEARAAGGLNVKFKGLSAPVPIHEITGIGDDCEIDRTPE